MSEDFTTIPLVDLSFYEKDKQKLASEIIAICEQVGFFYLINHGIPQTIYEGIIKLSHDFFDAPRALKQQIQFNEKTLRGYTDSKGTAKEKNECVRLGIDLPDDHPFVLQGKPLHGKNPSPVFMPHFKETVAEYIHYLNGVAEQLLELFAIGLGLVANFFTQHAKIPLSTLLLLKYPRMNAMSEAVEGCRPHTDFHCLTLLMQDAIGGLQVKNRVGKWLNAMPIENSFVVNIGDLLSFWTNGRFVATPHSPDIS